jgi:glycosyltransferase involved in cell wall biosynthesis
MTGTRRLRIALLGSRGIPARYGGYETLMEELAPRLVAMGHEVTVYCRSHYTRRGESPYRGVRLVVLPTIRSKHLDTPVHTFLSCLHAFRERYDAALVVNAANALFLALLGLARVPAALHVDGIERRRAKWGLLGRAVYALSERLASRWPRLLVSDAATIRDHYRERYGADSWLITYGVEARPPRERGTLESLGLEERRYFLYVSRFEPENNPHRVVEAYRGVGGDLPLVMVGDAPYAGRFIARLRTDADPRVVFPGAIYGEGYRELLSSALAFVQATEVGGTHPALVEAMGYGNCVVVNDVPENVEAAGPDALTFRAGEPASLTAVLERLRRDPAEAARRGEAAARRAAELYSWDAVSRRYADLFAALAGPANGTCNPTDAPIPSKKRADVHGDSVLD